MTQIINHLQFLELHLSKSASRLISLNRRFIPRKDPSIYSSPFIHHSSYIKHPPCKSFFPIVETLHNTHSNPPLPSLHLINSSHLHHLEIHRLPNSCRELFRASFGRTTRATLAGQKYHISRRIQEKQIVPREEAAAR